METTALLNTNAFYMVDLPEVCKEVYFQVSTDMGIVLLHKYIFPSGRVLFEKIQEMDGGFFFLVLQDRFGRWVKDTLWSREALREISCKVTPKEKMLAN